jgi:hypothetical protein
MRSELELHKLGVLPGKEEVVVRYISRGRKFAESHRGLVTGVAAGAVLAVFKHFVAEDFTVGDFEVKVLEEIGDAGEETDALDATGVCLAQELVDELSSCSTAFNVGTDDDGTDLGEVRAVDVEGCTAEELVGVGFDDGEGADVGADLSVGAGKERAVVGEALDQLMDGAGVLQLRFAGSQEDGFGFAAEDGSRWWGDARLCGQG